MTERQVNLIQHNWQRLAPQLHEAGHVFYNKLFALAPTVRTLFPIQLQEQQQKLMATLSFVVQHAHCLDKIAPDIKSLGARHHHYGAQPYHYEAVAAALLYSVQSLSGEGWDAETEDAWRTAINTLRNLMIVAQESERQASASKTNSY